VITVACVLVLSRGLQDTGVVDALAQRVLPSGGGPTLGIAALTGVGLVLSAFVNNVGAMALLLPLALQLAARHELPPGKVLMPLSFGTILGGMTTLIGTPPNLIVSAFREEAGTGSFGMFDFTPVGAAVAGAGLLFIVVAGWRLVPRREQAATAGFETGKYLTEARVTAAGKAAGMTLREVEETLDQADAQVVGMARGELRVFAPNPARRLRESDILIIEAEPESLAAALSSLGLGLEEAVPPGGENTEAKPEDTAAKRKEREPRRDEEVVLRELVVMPGSTLVAVPRAISSYAPSTG
jgi:di/tricarboxylate transporter